MNLSPSSHQVKIFEKVHLSKTIFIIIISSNIGYAQFVKTLGIKCGISNSGLSLEYREASIYPIIKEESENAFGFNVMLTGDFVMKKYWDINSSLGFTQKKSVAFYDTGDKDFNTLNYVSFINSVRGKLPVSKSINFFAQVGIRCDFLVKQSGDFYVLYFPGEPDLNKLNFGLNTGGGIAYNLEKMMVSLEVSSNFNFNKIMDESGERADGFGDEGYFYELSDKTYFFSLSLAWVIVK